MANRIMLNQTSYHGAGAIAEIVTEAKAHAFQKAFVCSDPDLIKFGVTGKVTDLLDKEVSVIGNGRKNSHTAVSKGTAGEISANDAGTEAADRGRVSFLSAGRYSAGLVRKV